MKTSGLADIPVSDESIMCFNQDNRGCPHDGEKHHVSFISVTVYATGSGSNCLDCDWSEEYLKLQKEGPKTLELDSQLTASKPGDVGPKDCADLLNVEVYQQLIERCKMYESNGKHQDCASSVFT